jgi:pimeloyl-ACP methyl ester carboxylesterase
VSTDVKVHGRLAPLESDLSTPLAYFLNNPAFQDQDLATAGLIDPERAKKVKGLYMLEPYQPGKIPVLMVHGLWSSPVTWMQMFNDLRSLPEIRDRYQFWFYLYPTGQPFWISAAHLREDLVQLRETIDPYHREPAMDQMVLVGHSMGGLVSKLQTLDSGDDFWRVVSDKPIQQVKAPPEVQQVLYRTAYFQANAAIRRVITIGTPHRGSNFANTPIRWAARYFIKLPAMLAMGSQQLRRDNPDLFRSNSMIDISTSVDSLAADSPILPVMLRATKPPWIHYHNIVGDVEQHGLLKRFAGRGDGVVPFDSAHLDDVESEIVVPADHVSIHSHPRAVLEVRRILLEHARQVADRPYGPSPVRPVAHRSDEVRGVD